MEDNEIGYREDPRNGNGIIRARTTRLIRAWDIPRGERVLEIVNAELASAAVPGNYILFEGKNKVYIGEAKNLINRLKTHTKTPDVKILNWDRAIIINDGRPATQSEFNDAVVRKALELYLILLLKANKYTVVSQGESQELNPTQQFSVASLKKELDTYLFKRSIISKKLEERGQEEVFDEELKRIFKKRGLDVEKWGKYEANIDGKKTYIRPGSDKRPKGWQITFRDRFLDSLKNGTGFLLVPRDGILFIPLTEVQKVIKEPTAYEQNTIDFYIVFSDDNVTLSYKDNTLDITKYRLLK